MSLKTDTSILWTRPLLFVPVLGVASEAEANLRTKMLSLGKPCTAPVAASVVIPVSYHSARRIGTCLHQSPVALIGASYSISVSTVPLRSSRGKVPRWTYLKQFVLVLLMLVSHQRRVVSHPAATFSKNAGIARQGLRN